MYCVMEIILLDIVSYRYTFTQVQGYTACFHLRRWVAARYFSVFISFTTKARWALRDRASEQNYKSRYGNGIIVSP